MAISWDIGVNYWQEERHSSSSLIVNKDEKSHCRLNGDSSYHRFKHELFSDMMLRLKSAAVDPCNLTASARKGQQFWSHILKVRKVLSLSNIELPLKKRKLDQLLGETSTTTSEFPPEKPNNHSVKKLSKAQCCSTSSVPCLISSPNLDVSSDQILQNSLSSVSSLEIGDNFSRKRAPTDPPFQARKEVMPFLHSDNLFNDLNSLSPPHRYVNLLENSNGSVNSSNLLSANESSQHLTPQRSVKLLNFIGDYLPRKAIPIGPRFQADIPHWTSSSNVKNSSRWLGTQIWPIEGRNTKTSLKLIGKGRTCSCSCDHLGSTNCIQQHISEERLRLKSELGPAFFSWRFHEMGEEVSKTWTLMEQKNFEVLVKQNLVSKNRSFWKIAMEYFPCRCRESIVSYYFNVFVLRRLSRQTRLAFAIVDSDDDDDKVNESVGKSIDLTSRYLIRHR